MSATQQLAALSRAAARIVSARSVQDLAAVAVRAGVEAAASGGGTVAIRDDARGVVRLSSTEHYNPELVTSWPELPLEAALPLTHVARTGSRLLLPDRASALARFPLIAAHQALTDRHGSPIVAAAVLPLTAPGRLLGALALTWPAERDFTTADLDLFDALAVLVAQALDRALTVAERDRALSRERLLARSGELLRAGLDPAAVLDATLDLVRPELVDRAWIRLVEGQLHGDPAGLPDELDLLEVPLVADGQTLGTLLCRRPPGGPLSPQELGLLRAITDRAALALAHALLFAEQRDTSIALQQALLTEPPEPDDLQIVVRYRPASHAAVGGDWYDAFRARDRATVLVVGDVIGHDAQAAAAMGQLRGLVRTLAYVLSPSPAGVLAVAEQAADGLSVSALATAVLARIDRHSDEQPGRRTLRWSNAGHLPPLLLTADGTVTVLDRDADLMLGVDQTTTRHDHQHPLYAGDTVLLCTDGLVERRGHHLDRGLAALATQLRASAGLALDELCDAVLTQLLPDGGEDDVALLAVRAAAPAPRPAFTPGAQPQPTRTPQAPAPPVS